MRPRLAEAANLVHALGVKLADVEPGPVYSGARRAIAERSPLHFALVYLPHHLKDDAGRISISEVHEAWIDAAMTWGEPSAPAENRDAYIAPREMGKSTWYFLILPMWAAATGRVKFAAAFADSAAQAETHLATFKKELDENARLREDYPDLCAPKLRPRGATVADHRAMLETRAGFVFAARGIDSGNLGMKVGEHRPDLLILDDVEPGESNYSAYQVEKRLGTILDVVLPLNVRARVCLVGTVTMPGSIIHQLVDHDVSPQAWVKDENFAVHHALPILTDDAGEARSVWPEKWSLTYLLGIRHTRSYAKNFLNRPVPTDGLYWRPDTFAYDDDLSGVTRQLLSIDPAVTDKKTSDFTGLALVGHIPSRRRVVVRRAWRTRATGANLRALVLAVLEEEPETTHVLVESNQGGDQWYAILHDLPAKLVVKPNNDPKPVRAALALNHYERGRVVHAEPLPELEEEACAFPKAPHDDLVDAVGNAVNRLLARPAKKAQGRSRAVAYT